MTRPNEENHHRPGRRRGAIAMALIVVIVAIAGIVAIGQVDRTQLWEDQQVYAGWRLQKHVLHGGCRLLDRAQAIRAKGRGATCRDALARAKAEEGLAPVSPHLVLLLHGMGRSPFIFRAMERDLRAAGYEAVAISYPSLAKDIAGHAEQLEQILERSGGVETVSFVTHSLGGIVLREALARDAAWRERLGLGRVVMLAPPNEGSELAASLDDWWLFHSIGGPSAGQLVTGSRFAAPPPGLEIGIIAGGTESGEGYNPLLSSNNDGVVTVDETRLEGATDFLVVPALHTFIASAPETIAATRSFLETGRFR